MSTTLTEERVAQVLDRADSALGELSTIKEKIQALETVAEGVKDLDQTKIEEEFEKLREFKKSATKELKRKRDGFYVSGIEDAPFNLTLALRGWSEGRGSKEGYEKVGAGAEFEAMSQSLKAAEAQYGREKLKASGITIGNTETVANFVADQLLGEVIPELYSQSVFINLSPTAQGEGGRTRVRVLDGLVGGEQKLPGFKGGFVPYWIGAGEDIPESKFKTYQKKLAPRKLGMLTSIDEDIQLHATTGFDGLMRGDMLEAMRETVDDAVAFGVGGREPLGICNTPGVQWYSAQNNSFGTVGTTDPDSINGADWQGGVLNFDRLDELDLSMSEQKVRPNPSKATISGDRYFKTLKQLKVDNFSGQSANQPYLLGMPMLTNARLAELIGEFGDSTHDFFLPSKPGASIGATSTEGNTCETVIRGNMNEVLFGRWAGVELTDDRGLGTGFAAGSTRVRMVMRCDVLVRETRALRFCPDAKVA